VTRAFHRARELFGEITDHRYELTLDREGAAFRAIDHVYEKPFGLNELSSGTQVQLVLAVCIAFLETQEQGCRAPLVFDETLANSDENRARAIIGAVKTICEEGRQVLCLVTQADEVQKWRGQLVNRCQLGGAGATPFKEEEFDRVQALAKAVGTWKDAWHVGRGRVVNRPALEQTDAVTDKYIDGVSEIAREQDGDAEQVLQIVRERSDERVKGFRSSKADDLEEYFLEQGYLVRQDPLSPEEMWQRVLVDLAEKRSEGVVSEEALEQLFGRLQNNVV